MIVVGTGKIKSTGGICTWKTENSWKPYACTKIAKNSGNQ